MLVINSTKKLIEYLGIKSGDEIRSSDEGITLNNWYGNIFNVEFDQQRESMFGKTPHKAAMYLAELGLYLTEFEAVM